MLDAIVTVSKHAYGHIVTPPPNRRNLGERSKREECWETFRDKVIKVSAKLDRELVDTSRPANGRASTSSTLGLSADAEIRRVTEVPAETWFKISRWAKETDNLLPWQRGLAFRMGRLAKNKKPPSAKQAIQAVKILDESQRRGFRAE